MNVLESQKIDTSGRIDKKQKKRRRGKKRCGSKPGCHFAVKSAKQRWEAIARNLGEEVHRVV